MKVNQISGILNDVYGEVLGEDNLFQEDLSNIISAGQIITKTAFGDNFDNYAGQIIDKVGRSIFVDRVYRATELGIWRDSWEYASMLEKVRCEVGDFVDNDEWKLLDGTDAGDVPDYNQTDIVDKLFKFVGPEVQAKYFNLKTTFRNKISITRKQLREAFTSASAMGRFIAMIENRIRTKLEIGKQELERRVVTNLACAAFDASNIVDLKSVLNSNLTFEAALKDQATLRGIAETMTMTRKLMTEPGKLYSITKKFMNFTPEEYSRLVVISDLDNALRFNLYGSTYNEEFVKLDGYKTVPYWQGRKNGSTKDALATRVMVEAYAKVDGVSGPTNKIVSIGNLVGVLFDRDAAMICNEDPEVRSQYNADGNFTNFFYNFDCSYYNDFDENAVVFVWGTDGAPEITLKKGTSGKTIIDGTLLPAGDKIFAKDAASKASVTIGDTFTTTGYTDITVGTTELSATANHYITAVSVENVGTTEVPVYKVLGVGYVKVASGDIGS